TWQGGGRPSTRHHTGRTSSGVVDVVPRRTLRDEWTRGDYLTRKGRRRHPPVGSVDEHHDDLGAASSGRPSPRVAPAPPPEPTRLVGGGRSVGAPLVLRGDGTVAAEPRVGPASRRAPRGPVARSELALD